MAFALALAACAQPALAGKPYEVVKAGDRDQSCQALGDEINGLIAEVARQQKRADREAAGGTRAAGAMGRGLLSGLAYGASSMAYGVSAQDALVSGAAQAAAEGVANAASGTREPAPRRTAASPVNSAERQRLDHLNAIFRDKAC